MGAPTTIQEARKQQQLARIERKKKIKTKEDGAAYAEWYGNQPAEVARAGLHAKHQAAVNAVAAAVEVVGIAEITGEGLEQAIHDHAVAVLVAERSVVPHRSAGHVSSLTAAGG